MTAHRSKAILIEVSLLAAVLAVGAFARFYGLGAKSLWLDEAATMSAVDGSYVQVLTGVIARDAHPPLYYALLHTWMQGSHSGVRARAFSAAASLATLVVFYGLARVLLGWAGALLATGVLAASAFQVYFAQEARHYALAAFLVTLSWYFFVQLIAGRRLERWPLSLGLALANTAALYTFYYCVFSVLAQLVVLLVLWRGIGRRLVVPWLSWQALPAALFCFYVPVILDRMAMLRGLAPPAGHTVISAAGLSATAAQFGAGFLARLTGAWGPVAGAAVGSLVVLLVVVALAGLREPRYRVAAAVGWLVGPVALLALLPIRGHAYEPKHLVFAAPALALLAGVAVVAGRGMLRAIGAAAVALLVGANVLSLALYYRPGVEKEDWRGAVGDLRAAVLSNDIVVFTPPYVELAFRYYYDYYYVLRYGKPAVVMWVRAPVTGEPFRAGELKLRPPRRVWVLEGHSNVEVPNPRVTAALAPYRRLSEKTYDGLAGQVRVFLYDTLEPQAP